MTALEDLIGSVRGDGFAFMRGADGRALIAACGSLEDWSAFAASWNDLEVDDYLAACGRSRKRRYAVYDICPGGSAVRAPHQAHHQHVEYNPLFGGVARWFAPVTASVGGGASMQAVLRFGEAVFGRLAPAVGRWHVEVHQFRIEANAAAAGHPTPEGVHRDGVDFVLVLLVDRRNIASGTTTVHEAGGRQLGSFTLTDPFDAALLDDQRVAHGVTPVTPIDPARPAYRDVLVVTFRHQTP